MYPLKIGIKKKEKFGIIDPVLNNEIEPLIIHLCENDDVNGSSD